MSVKKSNKEIATDALCIASEVTLVPGTSLLVKGQVKPGLVHLGLGLAAKVVMGPIGLSLVAANSICQAQTGESLYTKLTTTKGPGDTSLREEIQQKVDSGDSLEQIVETVVEDVEDIYHEATFEQPQQADKQTEAK